MSKRNEGLTKKDIMAIIRDIIIKRPDYKKYGFNKTISENLKSQFNINLPNNDVSRYIKDIEKEWESAKAIIITKRQIVEMLQDLYEESKNEFAMIKILREISELEGHKNDLFNNPAANNSTVVVYNIPDNKRDPVKTVKSEKKAGSNRIK